MTLYARFIPNKYKLSYVDETGKTIVNLAVFVDNFVPEAAARKKDGYTFDGWFTAAEGGRAWDFMKDMMPADDLILYARLSPKAYALTYIVDSNADGESLEVPFGATLPMPDTPVKIGHTFAGWYTEAIGGVAWDFVTNKMPASDLTL